MNKTVKWVSPSHHHRDHAGGVADYVAIGATLVVPHIARSFYSTVNDGDVNSLEYEGTHPFVLKGTEVQFRSMWHDEAPRARDWTYAVANKACPNEHDQW
jgi:glyoxylase-like metal-dependent hydrolase (beta-lactamase superfamily II)